MQSAFHDIVIDLQKDGTLRDIYIDNSINEDWNSFLDFVRIADYPYTFEVDTEAGTLPRNIAEIDKILEAGSINLSIEVAGKWICCHFFCDEEIELDFWPEDYNTPEQWSYMSLFLNDLVNYLQRKAIVTFENERDSIITEFIPTVI